MRGSGRTFCEQASCRRPRCAVPGVVVQTGRRTRRTSSPRWRPRAAHGSWAGTPAPPPPRPSHFRSTTGDPTWSPSPLQVAENAKVGATRSGCPAISPTPPARLTLPRSDRLRRASSGGAVRARAPRSPRAAGTGRTGGTAAGRLLYRAAWTSDVLAQASPRCATTTSPSCFGTSSSTGVCPAPRSPRGSA
jgi:hypothetical protein